MKKYIFSFLILTVLIFSGCGGGGSSSGSKPAEDTGNQISNEQDTTLGAPGNVTVKPAGISRKATGATPYNTANEITWDPVDGAIYYNLYWSNATPVDTVSANLISDVTSPYIHSGLDSSLTYYYIVTAVDGTGESLPSNEATATPIPQPQNVAAEAGDTTIRIRWDEVTGATSYNIYWLNSAGVTTGTGTKISVAASTGRHSYSHDSLTNNTIYYYIITAIDPAGEGSASDEVSAVPAVERLPATTSISATAGNKSNTITWDEVHGAVSYNLYWLNSTGVTSGNGNKIPDTILTTSYTHSNLTNGLDYYYVVTAVDDIGEGDYSAEALATPIPPVPSPPATVVATRGNTENTITWDDAAEATSYNIYWLNTAGVTTTTGNQLTGVVSPYTHSPLPNGTECYYIVTAVNSSGESTASSEVTATPVAPPQNPSATSGDGSNTITWDAVSGATSYKIYWLNTPGVTKGTGNSITESITTNSYTHQNLTNGVTYYYIVTAVDGIGEGTASGEVFTTPVVTIPSTPINISASRGNAENIITWDSVSGATSYTVYWDTVSGVSIASLNNDTVSTNSYTHTPLPNGTEYFYIVTAVNSSGASTASSEASATPVAPPQNPSVTPADGSNTISWEAVTGAISYKIYWLNTTEVKKGTGNSITVTAPTTSYTHQNLTNGVTYYYIITAIDSIGEGTASGEVSATPIVAIPSIPANVTATRGNAENIITWDTVENATSYTIYWDTASGVNNTFLTNDSSDTNSYTHSPIPNGTEYFYVVTAVNSSGASTESAEVSAKPVAPPQNPSATRGNNSIALSWSEVDDATAYKIYWSNSDGVTKGTGNSITDTINTNSYTHSGLESGLTYYYIITTVDPVGEGTASAQISATPTEAPVNVSATAGNAENTITWDAVAGAASYKIYWDTAPNVTTASLNFDSPGTNSYTHSTLTNGDTYYYIVTTVDGVGESNVSSEVSATPVDTAAIPANVTATAGDTENIISWDAVAGATAYNIYWNETGNVATSPNTLIPGETGTSYTHTGLNNGDTYYYVVTAIVGAEGAESPEVSATPTAPPAIPTAPVMIDVVAGNTINTISWTDGAGATSHNIYFNTTGTVLHTDTKISGVTSPYTHTGRTNGTTYYYIITAQNSSGESADSGEDSASPVVPSPSTPLNVSASTGNTQNIITWDPVDGAETYTISWNDTGSVATSPNTQITGETGTSYTHSGLTNGTAYYYIVTAVNDGGESSASSEVSATPMGIPVITLVSPGSSSNIVTWVDNVSGSTSYNIYWANAPNVTTGTGTQITDVTSPFTHANLTNGTPYYYILTAVNASGESTASVEESATPVVPSPSTPLNVATSPGNTQNVITWDSVDGAATYTISWNDTGSVATSPNTQITGETGTSYTHSGLTNGTAYYYIVTAVNDGGESSASSEVSGIPMATPAIDAVSPGDTSNIISWTGVSGATSYNIYWLTTSPVATNTGNKMTDVESPFTHAGLTNGTPYYYILTAVNGSGESVASVERSATPGVLVLPTPTNPVATPGSSEITITWDEVDGASEYYIYFNNTGGVTTGDTRIPDSITTNSYTHQGLTNDTTYYYIVTTVNATVESPASTVVSATPTAVPATPAINDPITTGNTINEISWSEVSGATSYNLYWNTTSGVQIGDNPITGITGSGTITYTHTGLTNGTTYYYILTAVNGSGESAISDEVSAVPAVRLPDAPANLSATPGNAEVVLIWDAVTGASTYTVYWGTATGVTTVTGNPITGIATNSYLHTGPDVINGTTYFYIITANNVSGEGTASAEASATPVIPIPPKPVNVTATPGNLNNTIIWDESADATGYYVYWGTASGVTKDNPANRTTTDPITTTSHIHTGLTAGDTYFYVVTAINSTGESSASDEVSAKVLYPRPVTDTGQTLCYDNLAELVDCPAEGEAFHGQDAQYDGTLQSYSKLDADGNVLPMSATSWAMVRDTGTGLIWEVKTDDDGTQDKDNTYTWAEAQTFVDDLNTISFGRFTDWRLPTVKELRSIVDNSRSAPCVNDLYFLNTEWDGIGRYWSATELAIYTDKAWYVHYEYGAAAPEDKTKSYYVRAVRGGP